MSKEKMEALLYDYGVFYTSVLADKLLKVIEAEKQSVVSVIVSKWQRMSNIGFEDYMRNLKEQKNDRFDASEYDKQIIQKTLDKLWKKAIMHDDYVELKELDNYIDEIISEIE